MALFRRSSGFDELLQRLKSSTEFSEIDDLVAVVLGHPDASPSKLEWMLAAENPKLREAAFEYFVATLGRDCAETVIRSIGNVPVQRRRELSMLLLRIDRRQVSEALRRVYHGPGRDQRSLVLEIIGGGLQSTEHLGLIKHAIRPEGPPALRRQAARLLRRSAQDPTISMILRSFIHDDDAQVRAEVIHALCDAPTPDMVEAMFARLPQEPKQLQATMLKALGTLAAQHGVHVEEHLFVVLADENADTRRMAAELLTKLPDPRRVLRDLLLYCRGLASWLRERAIDALLHVSDSLSEPLAHLIFDKDQDIRMAAMLLAARWNHASIVPYVTQVFLRDPDWWICSVAAEILAKFPGPEVEATLLQRLGEPDLKLSVIAALGMIRSDRVTSTLLHLLQDPERSIRAAALDGLRERAQPDVISRVATVAETDTDARVRDVAIETLRGLGPQAREPLRRLETLDLVVVDAASSDPPLEMEKPELNKAATGADD